MHEGELIPLILKDRDVFCPGCGYNLRDVRERRCPECGAWLSLHSHPLFLTNSRMPRAVPASVALYRVSVLGLVIGGGLFAGGSFLIVLEPYYRIPIRVPEVTFVVCAFAHPLGLVWLMLNRRFVDRGRLAAWLLVTLASWWWLAVPAVHILMRLLP